MTESPKFEFKLLGSIKRLKISPCFCVHLRIYMNFNYKKSMHTDLIENNLYNYGNHLFILIYNKWTDPRPHSNFIIYLHRILSSDCQVEFGLNASQKSLSGFKICRYRPRFFDQVGHQTTNAFFHYVMTLSDLPIL